MIFGVISGLVVGFVSGIFVMAIVFAGKDE